MGILLLAFLLFCCILLIPLGLPGTWLILGVAVAYAAMTHESIGWVSIVIIGVLAIVGEVLEFMLTGRVARRFGGSKRGSWGAIIGGTAGAIMGIPFPVPFVGSMIGAFLGAFAGAFLFEVAGGTRAGPATKVATGAFLGRVAAAAMKVGIGFVMAAWVLGAAALN
ncbi:MAG TPA: DUF456 domain-containing protein [Gemmatimonadaceae bacterium]|nr:DUF456 domain-containing protein [Gemmatimonadaceae bacterium]